TPGFIEKPLTFAHQPDLLIIGLNGGANWPVAPHDDDIARIVHIAIRHCLCTVVTIGTAFRGVDLPLEGQSTIGRLLYRHNPVELMATSIGIDAVMRWTCDKGFGRVFGVAQIMDEAGTARQSQATGPFRSFGCLQEGSKQCRTGSRHFEGNSILFCYRSVRA